MKKLNQKSTPKKSSATSKGSEQKTRALAITAYLKKTYPRPKSELTYRTQFQFLVAVVLSAQCTDKVVNRVTDALFQKYKTVDDFAAVDPLAFEKEISSVPFFRNKAKAIIASAGEVVKRYGGRVPQNPTELQTLPGVAYKTAHVIAGELFGVYEGIPTDTHVKRFAKRFELTQEDDLEKISKDLEALVPEKDWKYINNGLVLYGRYVCPAREHDCAEHPLTKLYPKSATIWPKAK